MKKTLKTKLVVSILATVLFFGSVATGAAFLYTRNVILNLQKDTLLNLTLDQSQVTNKFLSNFNQISISLSEQEDVKAYLSGEQRIPQDESILTHLNYYNVGNNFSAIYIMDMSGQTLVSTDPSFVGHNYSFRDYFKNAITGKNSMDVALGVTSKKLGYYFSSPVMDNGKILGVVVVKVKPESVDNTLQIADKTEESHIMLVDKYGIIVYTDKEERFLKSLGVLSEKDLLEIKDKKRYEGLDISAIQYDQVKESLANLEGVQLLNIYDTYDKEEEIIGMVKVGQWPLYIIVEQGANVYTGAAFNVAYILALVVILSALISSLIIFILIDNFVKPIVKLRDASKKVTAGDLSARVEVSTGDEFEIGRAHV